MVVDARVHDIVRLDPAIARRWPDAEAWVRESLLRAPWAVVRRERTAQIPIGIRGRSRSERYAAFIAHGDVACVVTPAELAGRVTRRTALGAAFADLAEAAQLLGVSIAPVGSFGFELASGVAVTTGASDLDILVHADRLDLGRLAALGRQADDAAAANRVRIDVELAFEQGAVALHEVLARPSTVLFKTSAGPRLLSCPV